MNLIIFHPAAVLFIQGKNNESRHLLNITRDTLLGEKRITNANQILLMLTALVTCIFVCTLSNTTSLTARAGEELKMQGHLFAWAMVVGSVHVRAGVW